MSAAEIRPIDLISLGSFLIMFKSSSLSLLITGLLISDNKQKAHCLLQPLDTSSKKVFLKTTDTPCCRLAYNENATRRIPETKPGSR